MLAGGLEIVIGEATIGVDSGVAPTLLVACGRHDPAGGKIFRLATVNVRAEERINNFHAIFEQLQWARFECSEKLDADQQAFASTRPKPKSVRSRPSSRQQDRPANSDATRDRARRSRSICSASSSSLSWRPSPAVTAATSRSGLRQQTRRADMGNDRHAPAGREDETASIRSPGSPKCSSALPQDGPTAISINSCWQADRLRSS